MCLLAALGSPEHLHAAGATARSQRHGVGAVRGWEGTGVVAAPSPCARDVHGCTCSAAEMDPSLDDPKPSRATERKGAWYGRWYTRWYTCCGGTPGGTPSCMPVVVLVAAGTCLLRPHRVPDQLCPCCAPAAALEVAADCDGIFNEGCCGHCTCYRQRQ